MKPFVSVCNIFLFFVFTNSSCNQDDKSNKAFVDKYFNEPFDDFLNRSIIVRGKDQGQNLILFVNPKLSEASSKGPYRIIINEAKKEIISTDCNLMQDSSNIDRSKLNKLALRFLNYGIAFLSVDSNKNIFINIHDNERPNLIKISNNEKVPSNYRLKEWKNIKGTWYEYVD